MRRMVLVLTVAAILAALMAASAFPAIAQKDDAGKVLAQAEKKEKEEKQETKEKAKTEKVKTEKTTKEKAEKEEEEQERTALPDTGGASGSGATLLGLGATALLICGGLLVRRIASEE